MNLIKTIKIYTITILKISYKKSINYLNRCKLRYANISHKCMNKSNNNTKYYLQNYWYNDEIDIYDNLL